MHCKEHSFEYNITGRKGESKLEFLFAPMEGITLSHFRRLHHQMFPGCSAYYTPFIAPDSKGSFKPKYLKDITRDRDEVPVIPQLLVNHAEAFHTTSVKLYDLGFKEINLNTGCPSGTVFSKHKGAGLLRDPEFLDSLLDAIFNRAEQTGYKVSIKTRMGVESTEEFPQLIEIYNKYPLAGLIVHARAREGYYRSVPDLKGFSHAAEKYNGKITYNGDIFNKGSFDKLRVISPGTESVMLGRGAVANPALARSLQGGENLKLSELRNFHDQLLEIWLRDGLSPRFTMERMKNLMIYMQELFLNGKKEKKAVFKAKNLEEYRSSAENLFSAVPFDPDAISFEKCSW